MWNKVCELWLIPYDIFQLLYDNLMSALNIFLVLI